MQRRDAKIGVLSSQLRLSLLAELSPIYFGRGGTRDEGDPTLLLLSTAAMTGAEGKLDGTLVTCPRHGSQFGLTDGQVVRWLKGSGLVSMIGKALKSPRPLAIYSARVEGDRILVEI